MHFFRATCHVVILLVAFPCLAADVPLVWKFQAGDEHRYRMTQIMDTQMALGAADRKIKTGVQQVIDMTWKVDEVDDQGQAAIVQSVDRIQVNMQAPGEPEMKFDTGSDDAPAGFAAMVAPLFQTMTDNPFKLTMSPRGEINDLEMPEAFTKALEAVPGAAMMGDVFSDEGFKNMVQKSSLVLPNQQDMTPGHEWTTNAEMLLPKLGSVTTTTTYRYLGPREVDGSEYEVFSIAIIMDFETNAEGIQIDIIDQDSSGEILFDRKAGRLESSKLQQEVDMQVIVSAQAMNQKMIQKVFFERIEKP